MPLRYTRNVAGLHRASVCLAVFRHAMLVPLLNTQGHVKAVVVLLNRRQCSCERVERLEEDAENQCACSPQVRALEPSALAVDAWSAASLPCVTCSRTRENELSYGEFLSTPHASLDIDCSRHFIRQAPVQSTGNSIWGRLSCRAPLTCSLGGGIVSSMQEAFRVGVFSGRP